MGQLQRSGVAARDKKTVTLRIDRIESRVLYTPLIRSFEVVSDFQGDSGRVSIRVHGVGNLHPWIFDRNIVPVSICQNGRNPKIEVRNRPYLILEGDLRIGLDRIAVKVFNLVHRQGVEQVLRKRCDGEGNLSVVTRIANSRLNHAAVIEGVVGHRFGAALLDIFIKDNDHGDIRRRLNAQQNRQRCIRCVRGRFVRPIRESVLVGGPHAIGVGDAGDNGVGIALCILPGGSDQRKGSRGFAFNLKARFVDGRVNPCEINGGLTVGHNCQTVRCWRNGSIRLDDHFCGVGANEALIVGYGESQRMGADISVAVEGVRQRGTLLLGAGEAVTKIPGIVGDHAVAIYAATGHGYRQVDRSVGLGDTQNFCGRSLVGVGNGDDDLVGVIGVAQFVGGGDAVVINTTVHDPSGGGVGKVRHIFTHMANHIELFHFHKPERIHHPVAQCTPIRIPDMRLGIHRIDSQQVPLTIVDPHIGGHQFGPLFVKNPDGYRFTPLFT